ncbi:MAG: hypothetical protein DHS20C08_12010 [Rhodomicrobium sp.]|nr:MAG: hypothetical protein DHS20C08_12010 [Rhodomicrobium sp.]
MSRIISIICAISLLALAGCSHRDSAFENQFELIGDHDVIPEPGDNSRQLLSVKDNGMAYGLDEAFSSRETASWRTRVVHSVRGDHRRGAWDTNYTHATKDFVADLSWKDNPVEIYKRTGRWPLRYTLDTGDRLRVIVYSQRTLTRSYTVNDSGKISVPLVGQVMARGATTKQVEQRIASVLRAKYLRDPKVSVEVATYRPFFVLGEVQAAGQFPYVVGMTAETAAAIAGGFTARADERRLRVSRVYKGRRYTLMVSKNFPIFPGDTVYVRERLF